MSTVTPFLWFDDNAQEAMIFYCSIFKDSKVVSSNGMGVEFELNGQSFMGMNAGPQFKFNEAISMFISCKDQAEVDYYWEKLLEGGEESRCGWLKDKYGLSWQVIPKALGECLGNSDPVKAKRALEAMLKMSKIEVAKLEEAVQD